MKYDFKEAEKRIIDFWEREKVFKFNPDKKGKIFSIDMPPPTVSGNMHIGHAFSYSQQDFIARFQRMLLAETNSEKGQVFYPFGTDDNGLPTERLVEKLNNVKSKEMSRKEFIRLCLKTLKEITPDFIQDWKNIGISSDFSIYYSTINDNSRKMSQKSFLELYKKGFIYKEKFPTIWCPECKTSIAQAELEDREKNTVFSDIKFKINKKDLIISTTRPELIPACVAIFVNPDDKRYKDIIGKKAEVPLFNYSIPIIADKSASIEKGTGAMMVCSYGDKYDVEAVKKHKLSPRIIFNEDGTLNNSAGKYSGLKIEEARKRILKDLKEGDLITNQKQISHVVNVHDKCGTPIEFIPTEQWFIKILDKKKKWIELGRKINWHPKFMRKRYEDWVNGLEWDWNISRDRYFGVPIPVWYCKDCKEIILAKESELPIDPTSKDKNCVKCKKKATPEKKVLDTWATSSLTPQIVSSLVGKKIPLPFSLRPQAHEIIRTWTFYTIVKSFLHENKLAWKNVMLSGFITLKGEKMSKSKGNVVSPREVLKNHGADALRFWAAGSKLGQDMDYHEKDLITGKKLITKLWNASKFVFMHLENYDGKKPEKLEDVDILFLQILNHAAKKVTENFEKYRYSQAKLEIEKFFWRDFADNYIEIVKKRVYQLSEGSQEKLSAQYTLYQSLLTLIKMLAPIMPFITEEIYQKYFREIEKDKSIHISKWPRNIFSPQSNTSFNLKDWEKLTSIISRVRQKKTEAKKPMNQEIILTLEKENKNFFEADLKNVTNAREIKQGKFKVEFIKTEKEKNNALNKR